MCKGMGEGSGKYQEKDQTGTIEKPVGKKAKGNGCKALKRERERNRQKEKAENESGDSVSGSGASGRW